MQGGVAVQKRCLSDLKWRTVYKVEFDNEDDLARARNFYTIEDRFPFKTRLAIDVGYKCPSPPPSVLAYDIETFLAGLTPDYRKDKVRSIACWDKDGRKYFSSGDERRDIEDFIAYVNMKDPDIFCDFYGRFYDLMVFIQRCAELNIKLKLGRDGSVPYLIVREFEKQGKGRVEHTFLLRGRCHFDVQKETDADYTLTLAGLKNRGLKEVAKHYGYKPVEIDYDKMDALSPQELEDYNVSDAYVSYGIGWSYLDVLISIAELLDLPLDMVIQRTPSTIPNIVLGRELGRVGIISDGINKERFPEFWVGGKKAIQGAEPQCFRTGVYTKNVKHKDFSSMYVSVMRALNLSPETVTLISITPYTGKYYFKPLKDCCICELPDDQNGQVTVRIDLSKKGVMREFLDKIVDKRNEAKKLMAAAKTDAERNKYKSDQIALKLVGNIMFGYHTMPFAQYGNVLIGLCDTAIPRLLINTSMKLEEEAGNVILEVDTDGYWYIENTPVHFDPKTVLPDCFETSLITQGIEDIQGIILLEDVKGEPAAKSYVLKEEDGKITKHGSSILSRSIPYIVDYFVDELAVALFNREDPMRVLRKWNKRHVETYPQKAFVKYVTLSKHADDYESTSMYANLTAQLKAKKIQVQRGDRINFVVCKQGYVPTICLNDSVKHQIDAGFYQEQMASIASRMIGMPVKQVLSYMKGDTLLTSYSQ